MWTTLKFKGRSKTKIMARNIYKRMLYIEFERDWSVSLGVMLDDGHTENKKKYFSSFRDFSGKSIVLCCGFRIFYKATKLY